MDSSLNLVRSITVAKSSSNSGTPSALNEFCVLIRKDGLSKEMNFNQFDQSVVSSVADKKIIPQKIIRIPNTIRNTFEFYE